MTYPPGSPGGYQPPQHPAPPVGAPAPSVAAVEPGPSQLPFFVNIGVAALGVLAYLANFGPTFVSSIGSVTISASSPQLVLWSLLGALVAAVGLVPSVKHTAAPAAVLSVLGLLYVIQSVVSVGEATDYGFAIWLVLLLVLLQAGAAVMGLLFDSGIVTPPAPAPKQDFGAYGAYGAPSAPYGAPGAPGGPGYPSQYGAYPPPPQPGSGGYPPPPAPQGPPTPPTGYPSFSPPPAVGSAPDPAAPAGPTQQIQTGQPPIPPASGPTPSL